VRGAGQRGAVFLADEIGAVFDEIVGVGHGGSLTGSLWGAEGESVWTRRSGVVFRMPFHGSIKSFEFRQESVTRCPHECW
jgi:hypothetical protein